MGFWNDGGFFRSVKGHVFKWWQLIIMPVLRINNNTERQQTVANVVNTEPTSQNLQEVISQSAPQESKTNENGNIQQDKKVNLSQQSEGIKGMKSNEDPLEVLNRINAEKEEKRRKEIEVARKKAQEQARIDAIMSANKVDVNAFIEAGKAAKQGMDLQNTDQKAQEILERLNREAAEDEAKKQAEIEAARQEAEKHIGQKI